MDHFIIKNLSEKSLEDYFERRIEESSYSLHICSSTFIWLGLELVSSTFFLQKEFLFNRKYSIGRNFWKIFKENLI